MTIEIANRLCAYRKHHGLSQEELADRIGVSRQAISKWERAETSPDTDNLIRLSQVYGVTLDDLLYTDPSPDAPEEEAPAEEPADEESADRVSFKHGIHIRSKDGDRVDIGLTGIHIDTEEEHVHIGFDGIHIDDSGNDTTVIDEDGHIFIEHSEKRWYRIWKAIPWPIICCAAYLLGGFLIPGVWGWGWLVFLTIPLYYSLADAIVCRDAEKFAFPVLISLIYLAMGLFEKLWHPGWLIFLVIPVYYMICSLFKKRTQDPE